MRVSFLLVSRVGKLLTPPQPFRPPPSALLLLPLANPFTLWLTSISVTLFLLASWLVLYGIRLQRRVMGHPR